MTTTISLKKEIINNLQKEVNKQRRYSTILRVIIDVLGFGCMILMFATLSNPLFLSGITWWIIGGTLIIIGLILPDRIFTIKAINQQADDITNPILKRAAEKALNELCLKASNQGVQHSFLQMIENMMQNNYSSWFTRSGKLKIDWAFDLNDASVPIIINDQKHFIQLIEILDEDYKYVDNEDKIIVQIDLLKVEEKEGSTFLTPITRLIPVEI